MTPSYGMIARKIRAARPWSSRGGLNAQNGVAFRNREPLHSVSWSSHKEVGSSMSPVSCSLTFSHWSWLEGEVQQGHAHMQLCSKREHQMAQKEVGQGVCQSLQA